MAIAYFIPDQAKLLAASSAHGSLNNSSSANVAGVDVGSSSNTSSSPTEQPHSHAAQDPSGGHTSNATHYNNSNHFRANITIPLSAYNASATSSDAGCWDLLAHIFCHALRFCHESERHPTVIQISLEISSSGPTGATTVQVGAQAAPVQPQATVPQQTSVEQQHSQNLAMTSPPVVHPTAVPQTAGTQAQPRNLATTSSERAVPIADTSATAMVSRNQEPGTHKPPAKRN